MKTYPSSYRERNEINLRQGIKSSLSEMKELLALAFSIYLAVDKKDEVQFSKEVMKGGNVRIEIDDNLYQAIKAYFGSLIANEPVFKTAINDNPLFTSQIEALQVTLELFWKISKVTFTATPTENARERTGGNRYNKHLKFSTNIVLLGNSLIENSGDISESTKEILFNWIVKNATFVPNQYILSKIQTALTIFSEETQFKIRKSDNSELFFQQEGIYAQILGGNTVVDKDKVENVGPFRILKSFVKSDLHKYIKEDGNDGFNLKPSLAVGELKVYSSQVNTSLNLIPKRTTIYQVEKNVSDNDQDFIPIFDTPCHQIIFYGPPGTGKSREVDIRTEGHNKIRTTFHPETDYQSFVGCYKPVMDGVNIKYEFVPQAFTKAYCNAWLNPSQRYFLIIEEINRGNCAQIFGDLFQCLDRTDNGLSKYEINCDKDLANYLKNVFEKSENKDAATRYLEIIKTDDFDKIILPNNLFIYATMNTSDQSLFPMDSAFKRRWDWEFVPINYDDANTFTIIFDDETKYNWKTFISTINPKVKELTGSEDKQLGNRFVNPKDGNISFDQFRSKVLFYLWSEVYKDEHGTQNSIFKYEKEENNPIDFQFGDLYSNNATEIVKAFLKFNGVEAEQ